MVSMAILVSLIYRRPPARTEPVYHGKPLSKWLEQLDDGEAFGISSGTLPRPTPAQIEAAEAIHAMGAEALPLLMIDIHARPAENSLRFRVQRRLNSLISRVLEQGFSFGDVTEKDRIRWRAAQGLAALGPLAKPALPELKRLLFTNYFHSSIKESAYALAAIGPEGVSILTNAVRPQAEWSGMCAIWALGQRPEAGTNVIPFLISATSSTSEGTACGAIQVLGLFQMDAEHVVPALTRALTSKNSSVSRDAASALGHFGPLAAPAAALLQTLTNDPATKASAIEALKQIQTIRR
jgi:HEAT repeat protein